jgi:PKD repeat protein
MKKFFPVFAIILFVVNSCGSDNNTNSIIQAPIAAFSFRGDTTSILRMITLDTCTLINKSTNADSVLWDFGDGRISRDKKVILSYPKSGTYILKLIAKRFDGQTSESSKKVIVLDRILKKIVIDRVQWDTANVSQGWPTTDIADIYFQIQLFTDNTMKPKGIYSKCPILFTSPIIKNINCNHIPPTYQPIEIPITEKFIIDKKLISKTFDLSKINNLYLFSVMAKDANGKSYCIVNNVWYNLELNIQDNFALNNFFVETSSSTSFRLVCDYE